MLIQNDRGRNNFFSGKMLQYFSVGAYPYRKRQLLLHNKVADLLQVFKFINGNQYKWNVAGSIVLCHCGKARQLFAAWKAPCCPEIYNQGRAFEIAYFGFVSV